MSFRRIFFRANICTLLIPSFLPPQNTFQVISGMGAKEEAKDLIAQRDKLDVEIEQNFEILKKVRF